MAGLLSAGVCGERMAAGARRASRNVKDCMTSTVVCMQSRCCAHSRDLEGVNMLVFMLSATVRSFFEAWLERQTR